MKAARIGLIFLFLFGSVAFAQVRITGFDRSGALTWTNEICAPNSVYEILKTESLTRPWEPLVSVTNQESVTLTGLVSSASTLFLKIAWVDHESLTFDYRFTGAICEGQGFFEVRLAPGVSGAWTFTSDFCEFEGHPEGQGQILFPWSTLNTNRLVLYIGDFAFDNKTWLDGIIEPIDGPRCSGLLYRGQVFRETIAGTGPIGTFNAQTLP